MFTGSRYLCQLTDAGLQFFPFFYRLRLLHVQCLQEANISASLLMLGHSFWILSCWCTVFGYRLRLLHVGVGALLQSLCQFADAGAWFWLSSSPSSRCCWSFAIVQSGWRSLCLNRLRLSPVMISLMQLVCLDKWCIYSGTLLCICWLSESNRQSLCLAWFARGVAGVAGFCALCAGKGGRLCIACEPCGVVDRSVCGTGVAGLCAPRWQGRPGLSEE